MSVQISHDGFARQSISRECVETKETCSWCGNTRKKGGLFRYSIQSDGFGASPNPIKGLFCSVPCMRTMNHQ